MDEEIVGKVLVFPDEGVPEDSKSDARARFEAGEACRWCGGLHHGECPRVSRLVFHPTDERYVREVEFFPDEHWSRDHIVFPEDVV